MAQNSSLLAILKAIIMVIFLPITLIWVVWKKTDWKKSNKWIATAAVVVVFIFLLSSGESADNSNKPDETTALDSQVEELKNQLEAEKQKNEELSQVNINQPEQNPEQPAQETAQPQEEIFKVVHVVDGDTIKLENGQVVRYIGIDTPETVDPRKPVQCFGKEASAKNKELVEGKEVRLVKDVSETDRYDRLLRYVYIGDTFVNDYLARNGFAKSSSYPPDIKFQDQFKEAQEEARNNKRGLWADDACKTENTAAPAATTPPPTTTPITPPTSNTSGSSSSGATGSFACNCSKTCPQMSSCAEAQYQLNTCGCTRRDADHDGIACDADCQ